MKDNLDEYKLIYVHKIGYNTKNEGQYEFVFSKDEMRIDVETWCWDVDPAADNATPPQEGYYDKIVSLTTKDFDLVCLHEAYDRPYIHGYHLIHALAYETQYEGNDSNGYDDYEKLFENDDDDKPLLVFHYGMTLERIVNMFDDRKITLKDDKFIKISKVVF